jgi:hypothetical protein
MAEVKETDRIAQTFSFSKKNMQKIYKEVIRNKSDVAR